MKRIQFRAGVAMAIAGVVIALAQASPAAAAGCTDSWIGGDGNWFVASNWSSGAVPASGDAVCITAPGNYTVMVAGQAATDTLQLGASSGTQKLEIQADNSCQSSTGAGSLEVFNHGDAVSAGAITGGGQLELTQDASSCPGVANAAYLKLDGGSLTNTGTITSDAGGATGAAVTGRYIEGSLTNSGGTIEIDANATYANPATSPITLDNAGTIDLADGVVLSVPQQSHATVINDTGGQISGAGVLFVGPGDNAFDQGAGTVHSPVGLPVAPGVIVDGATLQYTGQGNSSIAAQGNATLVGDLGEQQELAITCANSESSVVHASSFTNAGDIQLGAESQGPACLNGATATLAIDSPSGPGTGTLTNHGRIMGLAGTISGSLDNPDGWIVPGWPYDACLQCVTPDPTPGELTVTGDYSQGAKGIFDVIYYQPSPGRFGQLTVGGTATLDGRLAMDTGLEAPTNPGDTYEVLVAGGVSGEFSEVDHQDGPTDRPTFTASYGATSVTVVAGPAPPPPPEPSPPPRPPAPRCTLQLTKPKVPRPVAVIRCSQPVWFRLAGSATELLPRGHGEKRGLRKLSLRPVTGINTTRRTLRLSLPRAAVAGVLAGHRVTVRLTLIAKSADGTTRVKTRPRTLR